MFIENISLEHFSALPNIEINSSTKPFPRHTELHYFFSCDHKQDAATNNTHNKHLIELLKEEKLLTSTLSKIW